MLQFRSTWDNTSSLVFLGQPWKNPVSLTIYYQSGFDVTDNSPIVSILVVSYNTRDMTLECLRSVCAETQLSYELIVLDNASSDGSADAIVSEFGNITMLAEAENHGFAEGNNIAAEHAKGEYLLLLNPDTLVLEQAIDRLLEFAESTPKAKIWGGQTFFGDKTLNPSSCWRRISLWNLFCRATGLTGIFPRSALFNSEAYGGWDRNSVREVDIVSGCFFLIRREDWQALGGFDLSYFMYGEEADLCLRATRNLSAVPQVTPTAKIVHYGGASDTVRADKTVRLLKAKAELIKRHFPVWQQPLALGMFRLWPFSRRIAFMILKPKSESAKVWTEVWSRRSEWTNGFH